MGSQPHERVMRLADLGDVPLHLALVEPEIPPNTGNVARLCAATGCALHLVEPLGFRIDDRALKRAGLDYWDNVRLLVHPSLDAFVAATEAMPRWFFSTRGARRYDHATFSAGSVLIFGKETKGLPGDVLARFPDRILRIPMRAHGARSINLSTAVGIAAYAALERLGFPGLA